MAVVGIIGGTGPQGRGLTRRLAAAGHCVLIGSRSAERAQSVAAEYAEVGDVRGGSNAEAAGADLVIVTVPYDGHADLLRSLARELADKIVIDCVNPLGFDKQGPYPLPVTAGSAAQEAQEILTRSTVIGAFHHVSAVLLDDPAVSTIDGDVLVLGEDRDAVGAGLRAGHRDPGRPRGLRRPAAQCRPGRGAHRQPDRDQPPLQGPLQHHDHGPAVSGIRPFDRLAGHMTRPPRHTLHIVSGKGGTGKTTIAASLACALASRGRRVLLCEVEGRNGITELFDVPDLVGAEERRISRTPAGGAVYGLSIDAEDALLEYLDTFYHLGLAGKALDRFGAVDFATSIAPGLRDVLLTGKVYEAVRRGAKQKPNAYDAVVLDAPPTGRIAQFLNVHEAVAGLAKVGSDPQPGGLDHEGAALGDHRRAPGDPAGGHAGHRDRGGGGGAPADPDPGRRGDREHGDHLTAERRTARSGGRRESDHESARADGRAERRAGRGVRDRGRPGDPAAASGTTG